MEIGLVDHIADIPPEQFARLENFAGATGSYERVQQRESDGRWRASYVRCADEGVLAAVIPFYAYRSAYWHDPVYDPRTWQIPGAIGEEWTPDHCLLVGNYTDLRTSLHADRALMGPGQFRDALTPLVQAAAAQDRCLAFPYYGTAAKDALSGAADGHIRWVLLGRDAYLSGVTDPGWEAGLGKRVRYNLRNDRQLIDAQRFTRATCSWREVEDRACEQIAAHNVRKGRRDHPEYVRMRNREWDECGCVELVAFTVSSPRIWGVVTGMVYGNDLEVNEIGLGGEKGEERRAAYLDMVFRQPIAFARSRGLDNIRLGMAAGQVKALRGAVFHDIYCGVLDARTARRLADDRF